MKFCILKCTSCCLIPVSARYLAKSGSGRIPKNGIRWILSFNEAGDDGVAVASAGPYAVNVAWQTCTGNQFSTFLIARGVHWIILALARAPVLQIYISGALHPLTSVNVGWHRQCQVVSECHLMFSLKTSSCRWWCSKLVGMNGDESTRKMKWIVIPPHGVWVGY